MRILIAASEVLPFSKTGGLADMTGSLAKYLAKNGHQVRVITPFYRCVRESQALPELEPDPTPLRLRLGNSVVEGRILRGQITGRLQVCFVEQDRFYDRSGLYNEQVGPIRQSYPDNTERFLFLCKAAVALAQRTTPPFDIVHLHDWQTAPVALLIRHASWYEGWYDAPKTVLTIHNLAFQGRDSAWKYTLLNLPSYYFHPDGVEFYGDLNLLKSGMVFADALTTVSPSYAREILSPEYGAGLDGVLRAREKALFGILNGIDPEVWKTKGNPYLPYEYDARHLEGKRQIKRALQQEVGLPENPDIPLFGTVTRMEIQKGVDLTLEALPKLLDFPWQYVLLGTGDPVLVAQAQELARRYPHRMAFQNTYNEPLAHRIVAGADFYLMPSRYEPCGLNQMYAMHYGTIPIVHATGGLADSVIDETENPQHATGIKFTEPTSEALAEALRKAYRLYQNRQKLQAYQQRGMAQDFSWRKVAKEYASLFRHVLGRR